MRFLHKGEPLRTFAARQNLNPKDVLASNVQLSFLLRNLLYEKLRKAQYSHSGTLCALTYKCRKLMNNFKTILICIKMNLFGNVTFSLRRINCTDLYYNKHSF